MMSDLLTTYLVGVILGFFAVGVYLFDRLYQSFSGWLGGEVAALASLVAVLWPLTVIVVLIYGLWLVWLNIVVGLFDFIMGWQSLIHRSFMNYKWRKIYKKKLESSEFVPSVIIPKATLSARKTKTKCLY